MKPIFALLCFSLVSAQDFDINVSTSPVFPFTSIPYAVEYDESSQCVYIAGTTSTSLEGQQLPGLILLAFVSKLSLNGTRLWTSLFGPEGTVQAFNMLQSPLSTDLFVIGYNSTATTASDSFIVKLAANGTQEYISSFGNRNPNITDNSYGAYYLGAFQRLVLAGLYNNVIAITVHHDSNGSLISAFKFPAYGNAFDVTQGLTNLDCFVTGYTDGPFDGQLFGGYQAVFLSNLFITNGSRLWTRIWYGSGSDSDAGRSVQFDPVSRLVFVSGFSGGALNNQSSIGGTDVFTLCTRSNGTLLWTRIFGSTLYDTAHSMALHKPTGTLFVAGSLGYSRPGNLCYAGFVSSFLQNGTLLATKYQLNESIYWDIAFTKSGSNAYFAEYYGNFVFLNVSFDTKALSLRTVDSITGSLFATVSDSFTTSSFLTSKIPSPTPLLMTAAAAAMDGNSFSQGPFPMPSMLQISSTQTFVQTSETLQNTDLGRDGTTASISSYISYIAFAVAGAILLILICITASQILRRRRRKSRRETHSEKLSSTTVYSDTSTSMTQMSSMTTLVRTNFELSLPGFLQFAYGETFRTTQQIAKGGGGVVFLGHGLIPATRRYGPTIVIKVVGKTNGGVPLSELTDRQRKSFQQEIAIMYYFRLEKNIAKLVGWSETPACILMKDYKLGSLDKWIDSGSLDVKILRLQFMRDISQGVQAMHLAGFVHADLKPQNILVDTDDQGRPFCCLTDFGITQIVDDMTLLVKAFSIVHVEGFSTHYCAPEVFLAYKSGSPLERSGELVMKMDLFSLAVIFFELLELKQPWSN